MSVILGLTGPTGSGKSSASAIGALLGIKVVNCDMLSRKATEKGSKGLKALVTAFGKDILNADGTLNRKALAQKGFANKESTELLNKTILPFIVELVYEQIGKENVILDAPTLFESGIDKICTKTVAVLADEKIRLNRIIKRDSISEREAKLRMSAGKPDDFYFKADYTVYNNENTANFEKEIKEIYKNIFGGK